LLYFLINPTFFPNSKIVLLRFAIDFAIDYSIVDLDYPIVD